MRIMSFSAKWPKLQKPEFTTYRYPRVDRDWEVGERVQVFFKARSRERQFLGIAEIISMEHRELDPYFAFGAQLLTDVEAVEDGFESREHMVKHMEKFYGRDYISIFHKLTLRWKL